MRQWTYSWTSSDGLKHEGEVRAHSKDDAYAALRAKGIHPMRVTERIVPVVRRGLRGLRKRDIVLVSVLAVALALAAWILSARYSSAPVRVSAVDIDVLASSPELREEIRRVIEDRKAIEQKCREDLQQRVRNGAMTKEAANEMFRAMGMAELP